MPTPGLRQLPDARLFYLLPFVASLAPIASATRRRAPFMPAPFRRPFSRIIAALPSPGALYAIRSPASTALPDKLREFYAASRPPARVPPAERHAFCRLLAVP